MTTRASVSVQSCSRLSHSSRKRPWKLSTKPFCQGLDGSQHIAFASALIQDGQHPQGSAPRGRIRDEVPRPDMASMIRLGRQAARPEHIFTATASSPSLADAPGSQLFFAHELQHPVLQQRLHQHLVELRVLPLKLLQPLDCIHFHLPKLPLPSVECHLRDARPQITSPMLRPPSACRKMRILSSVSFAFHFFWFLSVPD